MGRKQAPCGSGRRHPEFAAPRRLCAVVVRHLSGNPAGSSGGSLGSKLQPASAPGSQALLLRQGGAGRKSRRFIRRIVRFKATAKLGKNRRSSLRRSNWLARFRDRNLRASLPDGWRRFDSASAHRRRDGSLFAQPPWEGHVLLALSVRTPPGKPAASSEAEAECSRSWNGALYPYHLEFARASRCCCSISSIPS